MASFSAADEKLMQEAVKLYQQRLESLESYKEFWDADKILMDGRVVLFDVIKELMDRIAASDNYVALMANLPKKLKEINEEQALKAKSNQEAMKSKVKTIMNGLYGGYRTCTAFGVTGQGLNVLKNVIVTAFIEQCAGCPAEFQEAQKRILEEKLELASSGEINHILEPNNGNEPIGENSNDNMSAGEAEESSRAILQSTSPPPPQINLCWTVISPGNLNGIVFAHIENEIDELGNLTTEMNTGTEMEERPPRIQAVPSSSSSLTLCQPPNYENLNEERNEISASLTTPVTGATLLNSLVTPATFPGISNLQVLIISTTPESIASCPPRDDLNRQNDLIQIECNSDFGQLLSLANEDIDVTNNGSENALSSNLSQKKRKNAMFIPDYITANLEKPGHFICPNHETPRSFQKQNIRNHLSCRLPPEEYPFICETCEERFPSDRLLKYHCESSKTQGQFYCANCRMSFATRCLCRLHQRTCNGDFNKRVSVSRTSTICEEDVATEISRHLEEHGNDQNGVGEGNHFSHNALDTQEISVLEPVAIKAALEGEDDNDCSSINDLIQPVPPNSSTPDPTYFCVPARQTAQNHKWSTEYLGDTDTNYDEDPDWNQEGDGAGKPQKKRKRNVQKFPCSKCDRTFAYQARLINHNNRYNHWPENGALEN